MGLKKFKLEQEENSPTSLSPKHVRPPDGVSICVQNSNITFIAQWTRKFVRMIVGSIRVNTDRGIIMDRRYISAIHDRISIPTSPHYGLFKALLSYICVSVLFLMMIKFM